MSWYLVQISSWRIRPKCLPVKRNKVQSYGVSVPIQLAPGAILHSTGCTTCGIATRRCTTKDGGAVQKQVPNNMVVGPNMVVQTRSQENRFQAFPSLKFSASTWSTKSSIVHTFNPHFRPNFKHASLLIMPPSILSADPSTSSPSSTSSHITPAIGLPASRQNSTAASV